MSGKREELIEKVGRRLFGSTVDSMGRARELARLALDLFEQSPNGYQSYGTPHTPTNDELDYYDPARQDSISEHDCVFEDGEWWFGHGMPCKHPALHVTPTNDERARVIAELRWLADARKEYETDTFPEIARQVHTARQLADILERRTPVADGGEGFGWLPSWRWDEWDQMASRRPVQGEPTDSWAGRARRAEAALLRVRDIHIATMEALSETFSAVAVTEQGENRD